MIYRITLFFLLALPAFGADLTVTPSGDGDAYTLSEANQRLEPGDTAYLQPGTYNQRIEPVRSGKDGAYITYSGTHDAVIKRPPGRIAIVLDNKSHIRIIGVAVDGEGAYQQSKIDSFVQMNGGGWNIIENADFRNAKGWGCVSLEGTHHNKIVSTRMDQCGAWLGVKGEGVGDMITLHCATHTLIAGNDLSRGGHTLIANNGNYNVIRNNLFDQKWAEGKGYRAMELTANMRFCSKTIGYSLVELNTFRNMLKSPSKDETTGFKVEGEGHIVRFNVIDKVAGPATTCVIRPPIIPKCEHSRIYNNTVKDAGVLWKYKKYGSGEGKDTILQNNALINTSPPDVSGSNKSIANGPASDNGGEFLTETKDAGEGKTVAVGDARWFTDGFGVVPGDLVRVGGNPPVQVTAVDYQGATLTFTETLKWEKGAPVSLPWDGSAPPVGAVVEDDDTPDPDPDPPPPDPMVTMFVPVKVEVKAAIAELAAKCGMKTGRFAARVLAHAVDPTVVTCE